MTEAQWKRVRRGLTRLQTIGEDYIACEAGCSNETGDNIQAALDWIEEYIRNYHKRPGP